MSSRTKKAPFDYSTRFQQTVAEFTQQVFGLDVDELACDIREAVFMEIHAQLLPSLLEATACDFDQVRQLTGLSPGALKDLIQNHTLQKIKPHDPIFTKIRHHKGKGDLFIRHVLKEKGVDELGVAQVLVNLCPELVRAKTVSIKQWTKIKHDVTTRTAAKDKLAEYLDESGFRKDASKQAIEFVINKIAPML